MAMAIALSCSHLSPTAKLPHSMSQPTTLPFPHKSFSLKSPIFPIFRSQYDGSGYEEAEAVDEPFFRDLVEESDDDETESSIDLLMRFLQIVFRKVSKRAKKASCSILPAGISPQLVSFAVDGVLLLAALSILKSLLEVVCTLGGTVFVVIMLLRVIWAAVSYFQPISNSFNQGEGSFGASQPII
ncbi:methyltransferase-like protein 7A [Hibiscus syriacus]|uniref:Methyltransferase-like protein 7A n=1 Tax=Hibiscus syriacus TaxID=106335 RepID=A0A6A3AE47_HIBSY|nr:protein SHORT HYPOCOTYL IN WHITE LIGHT 1-like [Hibiscus syriacus]KAE8702366.1 methyltransferase-like protein 7A [Hibiscus syriacus]